jgi:type III pantothenate kinase
LLSSKDIPLSLDVELPGAVGMDRLVAALAANRIRTPSCAAIVIDAGTAITVDVVDQAGCFRGGAILCSMRVAARALAAFTDLLPEIDTEFSGTRPPVIGRSTRDAMRSGLFYGCAGAVRELVHEMSRRIGSQPELIVTGGGARPLVDCLQLDYRFIPDLVLDGVVAAADHLRTQP